MTFSDLQDLIRIRCGRRKVGSPTLNSQPGAHTGTSRKYIPGYADANIVYLDTASGNDSNDGSTELLAKATYSSAATAAGSTKKIRVINDGATLSTNITKPTEMKRGVSGTISGSLTTPIDTFTQSGTLNGISGSVNGVLWVPWLSKWYSAGGSSKLYSSTDGDTWTAVAGHSFGSDSPTCLYADRKTKTIIAGGTNGKIAIAQGGESFVQVTTPFSTSDNLIGIAGDEDGTIVAVTVGAGLIAKSTDAGETWEIIPRFIDIGGIFGGVAYGNGKWVFCHVGDVVWVSTDLQNFTKSAAASGTHAFRNVFYSEIAGLFLLANEENSVGYTSDGLTISTTAVTDLESYGFAESVELGKILLVGGNGTIYYSTNGTSWTAISTPSFSTSNIFSISWSPLLGRFAAVGSSKAARSTAYQYTISANVAGFSIQAMQYSSTPTLYNCTLIQPGGGFNTDGCRITESGAHISNNAQAHFGNLIEGDFNVTGIPASQNAIALNCNTITGKLSVFNSSSTTYEQIRDNIIEGGFYANYATIMLSGNLRGTNTNGLLSKSVRFDDPGFVDTTDYKLKRKTQGDDIDSPLVAAASYYVNEQGEQRDIGAWSLDDSALPYDYSHTFFVRKPAGQGLKPKKVPMASADQGIDGVWDATNEPARASEYLTFQCTSVPIEDVQAQDIIESLTDLTCEVCLDPKNLSPTTDIVVNGNHSAGEPVLNIDASTTIKSGMVLPIGGKQYFILYTIGGASVTKLVLHKPLASAVSNNATITPNEPVGDGTYQFVPQQRETPRPHAQETDVALNLSWTFVRQYPQI